MSMSPIKLVKKLFSRKRRPLTGLRRKDWKHIGRLVAVGVESRENWLSLRFDPTTNLYWVKIANDRWSDYEPISANEAQALKDDPENFSQFVVDWNWQESEYLDERNTNHHPTIARFIAAGASISPLLVNLKKHQDTNRYWLKQLVSTGLGQWHTFELLTERSVELLLENPESVNTFGERFESLKGWLDELKTADQERINSLEDAGVQDRENGIALMQDAVTSLYWIRHQMIRNKQSWFRYQPISIEQAQLIQSDKNEFRHFTLHNWIVSGRLNEFIPAHRTDIDKLVETDIAHPTENIRLLRDEVTGVYWIRLYKRDGCLGWYEYQPISEQQAVDLKANQELLLPFKQS